MRPYAHFTLKERICLEGMRKEGKRPSEIARLLGRSRSTISRELRRNGNRHGQYSSWGAYSKAAARRKKSVRKRRVEKDAELHDYVREKLRPCWSPELTAAMWNRAHPDGLLTLVDRKSRMLLAVKVNDFSGGTLHKAVMRAFDGMPPKSLTFDNGSEFARWKDMERDLNATVYFADPHSPWQRGSNENVRACYKNCVNGKHIRVEPAPRKGWRTG